MQRKRARDGTAYPAKTSCPAVVKDLEGNPCHFLGLLPAYLQVPAVSKQLNNIVQSVVPAAEQGGKAATYHGVPLSIMELIHDVQYGHRHYFHRASTHLRGVLGQFTRYLLQEKKMTMQVYILIHMCMKRYRICTHT